MAFLKQLVVSVTFGLTVGLVASLIVVGLGYLTFTSDSVLGIDRVFALSATLIPLVILVGLLRVADAIRESKPKS